MFGALVLAIAACSPIPQEREATLTKPAPAAAKALGGWSEATGGDGDIPELTGAEMAKRYRVFRFIDKEAGVLCYGTDVYDSKAAGTLSCVPRSATTIRR
jgi:hypothetical protein